VSWPGNDFYAGARATDDGVKAAATDSMRAITGVEGHYDPRRFMYLPPAPHENWAEVVDRRKSRLWRPDNISIQACAAVGADEDPAPLAPESKLQAL
jgi:hypothetical protein